MNSWRGAPAKESIANYIITVVSGREGLKERTKKDADSIEDIALQRVMLVLESS